MPNVDHHDDTLLISLNVPHVREKTGWTHQQFVDKSSKYKDMRDKKLRTSNEYIESIDTSM